MPKVTIKREGGVTIEAELTFDQLKELAGVNGHRPLMIETPRVSSVEASRKHQKQPVKHGDFEHFFTRLSDRAQNFLRVLRPHVDGIEANALAAKLGLKGPNQIGGLVGPGISKLARANGIHPSDIYKSEVIFPNGERMRMFYPGRLTIDFVLEETPLFTRGA